MPAWLRASRLRRPVFASRPGRPAQPTSQPRPCVANGTPSGTLVVTDLPKPVTLGRSRRAARRAHLVGIFAPDGGAPAGSAVRPRTAYRRQRYAVGGLGACVGYGRADVARHSDVLCPADFYKAT